MTSSRRSRRSRLVTLLLLAGALLVGLPTVARAADPVIGVTNVRADGNAVTGVLTMRGTSVLQVDPRTITATVDGVRRPVALDPATHLVRRAMLVIDTSGSMGASGMATVRAATATYLRAAPADVLVGVVSFANTAGVDLAPTRDRAAVQRVVDGLVSRGDTSLYAAVRSAIDALGPKGDRSIVLLSDGADTTSANRLTARADVAAALTRAGIRVDVVRFKTNDPDATAALQSFARSNGGSVVPAGDTAAVDAAFRAAAKALDSQVQFRIITDKPLTGSHTVRIEGRAGGQVFAKQEQVAASQPPSQPPSASPPAAAGAGSAPSTDPGVLAAPPAAGSGGSWSLPEARSWFPALAAALLALGLALLAGTALTPSLQTRRERRVAAIDSYVAGTGLPARSESKAKSTPIAEQLVGLGDRYMQGRESTKSTMALIERADLPFRAGEWFVLRLVAAAVGAALLALLARSAAPAALLLALVLGAVAGLLLPSIALKVLAARRAKAFEQVLPDVLTLVSTSLRSGFGLAQALDAVARDAAEPAAKEFGRALAETRIGTDISDALEHMAARMDSTSMRWAVMAVRIQREVGGNLADTLTTTAATLRERESLHRQVRALSAEGRLSAYILIAMPIGIFFYMTLVNYAYISQLWTQPLGLLMLGGGIVMLVAGVFWMRNVVRIEV